ncbi:uncharacterized protein SOCE26_091940 [Sorangium cellulosum]|uniref:Uncharacterized protein n=1 Tax=Sorangium cellulosum TaxID=56 RepID=A0A2L0F7Y1_SORCE|nr:uncharacterized protein SOCE26_091940 [Sorangium cellulosum]
MDSLIDKRERTLALKAQAAKRRLMAKALLIRRLKQPRTEMPMYFDARRDHLRGSILKSSRLPAFMCHLFSFAVLAPLQRALLSAGLYCPFLAT